MAGRGGIYGDLYGDGRSAVPFVLHEPDLSPALQLSFESIARRCSRGVQGCATDKQYEELVGRIIEALAFASGNIKPMALNQQQSLRRERDA